MQIIKKIRIVFIIILLLLLLIWLIPFLKIEISTLLHREEFNAELLPQSYLSMCGKPNSFKVIEYSDMYAEIYYINDGGNIVSFSKTSGGNWEYQDWERTVWAKTGNADEYIWPYFYHSGEGKAVAIVLGIPLLLILLLAYKVSVRIALSKIKIRFKTQE